MCLMWFPQKDRSKQLQTHTSMKEIILEHAEGRVVFQEVALPGLRMRWRVDVGQHVDVAVDHGVEGEELALRVVAGVDPGDEVVLKDARTVPTSKLVLTHVNKHWWRRGNLN